MRDKRLTADRLGAFSNGVIAVIITVMVLELKAPEGKAFADLVRLHLGQSPPSAAVRAVSHAAVDLA